MHFSVKTISFGRLWRIVKLVNSSYMSNYMKGGKIKII